MSYSGKKVASSLALKFIEQLLVKLTSLVVGIVLARILDVADFGVVAILTVFVHIARAVIEGGLSTSLIQKKSVDDTDYSTVFFTSFGLAVIMYIVLFFSSPIIANYYNNDSLIMYLKIIGTILFITPFNTVQLGYVYKNMLFRKLLIATLTASILSGIVGIIMAYMGFGAWALVVQTIINSVVSVVMLLILVDWKPKLLFSFRKLKEHFSYGWKLLASSILDTIYNEMRSLVIGKRYTSEDLAFYSRGDSYPKTIMTSLNTSVQTVLFPVLSSEQDNREQMKAVMRKTVAISSYVVFPVMAGFAAVAESFVRLVLTDKWLPCVPYLELACIIYAIQPINSCNLQAIKAIGRSDIFLIIDLIKKVLGFIILFVSAYAFHSPMAIAVSSAIYAPIQLMINTYPNKKFFNYSLREQVKDIALPLVMSILMFIVVIHINKFSLNIFMKTSVQIVVGITIYLILSVFFRVPTLRVVLDRILLKVRK